MKLKQKLDDMVYGYNPKEFMPIFVDGQLANRTDYLVYKLRRAARLLLPQLHA